MINIFDLQARGQRILNWSVTIGSVILCALLLLVRLPGMELLGLSPNWLLIWVVAWSVNRTAFQGAIAGIVLGLLQDSMTFPFPSHAISLAVVGILTARLKKKRYIQEDFISVALIVFGMAALAETIMALQFTLTDPVFRGDSFASRSLGEIWTEHQRIALASAILSSLWAPVVYYPLNHWWKKMHLLEP